jgi:hypothetical protein
MMIPSAALQPLTKNGTPSPRFHLRSVEVPAFDCEAPHRARSVYCPVETGGTALVAGSVLRLDRERVATLAQARVGLEARADTERGAIKLADEAHPRLSVAEAKARAGLVRWVGRHRCKDRRGRGCGDWQLEANDSRLPSNRLVVLEVPRVRTPVNGRLGLGPQEAG